ncbi:MAG: Tat pathway signal protein, partial [Caulobacterales bacterium]|nr:Tat pathway signal protein [Caulobacterales bacterium]
VGRAVRGRRIIGDVPIADFDHDYDAGGGRLIPSTAVEQLAAPLGRWFGLNDAEIAAALPNLSSFAAEPDIFT